MENDAVRRGLIYIILGLYILYGLGNIGMTGLLFSAAVGIIVSSFDYGLELCAAATIVTGLLYGQVLGRREAFQDVTPAPTGDGQSGAAITKKIQQITRRDVFEPSGVLSSSFAEGFADTDSTAPQPGQQPTAGSDAAPPPAPTATSTPANTKDATASTAMAQQAAQAAPAAAATPSAQNPPAAAPPATTPPTGTSGFSDKASDGMFKLGSIPADAVGGSHIDVGTTLMNALNSLKPDQVKQMTDDTRKLMETQKSLIGMLNTMKPMLQDGKQMMDTFSGMFGAPPK